MRTFLVLMLSAHVASAATYWVATNGVNTNPGTEALPFLTVQKGLDVVQPGDTVKVGIGYYNEAPITKRSGTAESRITIDGRNSAVVRRIDIAHERYTVKNITITGQTSEYTGCLYVKRGGHYLIASNIVIDAALSPNVRGIDWQPPSVKPIGTDAASHALIISNRITGVARIGAVVMYGSNNVFYGNTVHDVGQADFLQIWGVNNRIACSVFTNNYIIPGAINHMDFIQVFGDTGYGGMSNIIERNIIVDLEGQFSQMSNDLIAENRDWVFRNNIAIRVKKTASVTMPGVQFYNNLFYECNYGDGGPAINFSGRVKDPPEESYYAHGGRVYNNVFLACGNNEPDMGWYIFFHYLTNVTGGADFNYVANSGFQPKTVGPIYMEDGLLWDRYKFLERNGINGGNPDMVSLSDQNLNFNLQPTSFLLSAGTNLTHTGMTDDFYGVTRTNWSIGPFDSSYDLLPPLPQFKHTRVRGGRTLGNYR